MARSLARDAEDFARLMLQTIERLSQGGDWIRATDAFEQTLGEHPDHAYVAQLQAKPTRRIGLSGAVERIRGAEFPHIERRKAGNRRSAPVFYRIARAGPGLDLQLPYEVAASHPLVVQRRAEAAPRDPGSARRAALTRGRRSRPGAAVCGCASPQAPRPSRRGRPCCACCGRDCWELSPPSPPASPGGNRPPNRPGGSRAEHKKRLHVGLPRLAR